MVRTKLKWWIRRRRLVGPEDRSSDKYIHAICLSVTTVMKFDLSSVPYLDPVSFDPAVFAKPTPFANPTPGMFGMRLRLRRPADVAMLLRPFTSAPRIRGGITPRGIFTPCPMCFGLSLAEVSFCRDFELNHSTFEVLVYRHNAQQQRCNLSKNRHRPMFHMMIQNVTFSFRRSLSL